jgi:hypothetical protein
MAKTKKKQQTDQYDIVFGFKLVLYVVLGSMWLKLFNDNSVLPLPLGLVLGLVLASHEHFAIDRKIEYAVLIIAALVGFIAPYGLYIAY